MGWLKIQVECLGWAVDSTRDKEKTEQRIMSIEGPGDWVGQLGADQVWGQDCKVQSSAWCSFQERVIKNPYKNAT